jgi:hypothetical protein
MKSRLVKFSAFLLFTVLVCFVAEHFARAGNVKPMDSFTIHMTHATRLREGSFTTKRVIYAFKSDGSIATWDERQWGNGQPVIVKTIRDVPNRQIVSYEPATRSKITRYLNDKEIEIAQGARVQCVQPEDGDVVTQEGLLGFEVTKTVEILPSIEGRRLETWRAKALNCWSVKSVLSKPDPTSPSGWLIEGHQEATSITLGEPEARFFEEPQDHTERSLVEMFAEIRRIIGRPIIPY